VPEPEPSLSFDAPAPVKPTEELPPPSFLPQFRREFNDPVVVAATSFDTAGRFAKPETPAPSQSVMANFTIADEPPPSAHPAAQAARPAVETAPSLTVASPRATKLALDAASSVSELPATSEKLDAPAIASSDYNILPRKRPEGITPWISTRSQKTLTPEVKPIAVETPAPPLEPALLSEPAPPLEPAPPSEPEAPKLKLGIKPATPQSELSFDSTPRGRFEGESPNVFDGEDLDIPPFLRKRK
jgi:hypothetical protein